MDGRRHADQPNVRFVRSWDWEAFARVTILIGAVVRAAWVFVIHSPLDSIYSDSKTYVDTATHLATLVTPERFDAFYPPGTRVLMALPLALIGPGRDGLSGTAVLWFALSALTPYFMWRFLRLIVSRPAAAIGAGLCALWPLHIAYAGFFTSETPGLAFLALSLWLAEAAGRRLSTRDGMLAGIAGGVAAAIRPAFALNVVLAALPLARRSRLGVATLAALAGGALLVLVLVLSHEAWIAGRLVGVSENSGVTFYLGHCDVRRVTTGTPETLQYTFQTPVATQLNRGADASFADHQIWDQGFFYAQGLQCIANDGLAHLRVIVRNIYDMGLSTIPWPPSNDDGLRQVTAFTNVSYTLLLPFIVWGAVRMIRRYWAVGGGRGELMLLGQLALALVTAVVYFGDPRFRTPFDVFGLGLVGSLVADQITLRALRQTGAPAYPRVRVHHAVQQDDEGAVARSEAAGEVDAHDARSAEADGALPIGARDGASEEALRGEGDEVRPGEVLSRVLGDVHEEPAVGPEPVEPKVGGSLEAGFTASIRSVRKYAPDAWTRDEDPGGVASTDRASEEVDPATVEDR